MGFFSANCPGCGHSIRSTYSTNETSAWMKKAVVLFEDGARVTGEYGGYGDVEGEDDCVGHDATEVWHAACHTLKGKPGFTKPSAHARDQGYFVGKYDPAEPTTVEAVNALLVKAKRKAAAEQRKAQKARLAYIAKLEAEGKPVPEWMRPSA